MTEDELIRLASCGSRDAQAALVEHGLYGVPDEIVSPSERLASVEWVARMAASHGWSNDRLRLAGILLLRAEDMKVTSPARHAEFLSEALDILHDLAAQGVPEVGAALMVLLNELADEGNEAAAEALNEVAAQLGPAVVAEAKDLRTLAEEVRDLEVMGEAHAQTKH